MEISARELARSSLGVLGALAFAFAHSRSYSAFGSSGRAGSATKPVPSVTLEFPASVRLRRASAWPSQKAAFVAPLWRKPCVPAARVALPSAYEPASSNGLGLGERMYLFAPSRHWPSPKRSV